MSITKFLADKIVSTQFENLPKEVVEKTKRHILDTLGVMLPPTTLERGCITIEKIAREGAGKKESTFVGFGGKGPSWMAAFVNGVLCHPMDYDDTIDEFANHCSCNVFPSALAVAEKMSGISGKEFITAMALGIDLNVRLSSAPKGSLCEDYPWFAVTLFGPLSATAGAGKILGLSCEEMINSLGIAVDRCSGITESVGSPNSEIRAIRDGFTNREAVFAALMAKKGITACQTGIDKFFKAFYGGNHDPSIIMSKYGEEFAGMKVSLKPWPCCRVAHTHVTAALKLAKEKNIDPDEIMEVLVTVGRFGRDKLCEPLEQKQRPKQSINAKFSLPFIMGVVFKNRKIIIEDFLAEKLHDPEVLKIAKKVTYKFDPELSKGAIGPGVVEVKMKDGRHFLRREDISFGHPQNPMSDDEVINKFKDCARYSKRILSDATVNKLVDLILGLEKVKDIKEITEVFA